MQSTDAGVQDIVTLLETVISEGDASTLVSLCPIKIAPINCDILKQTEGRKRKGNMHMTPGVDNKKQPISCK